MSLNINAGTYTEEVGVNCIPDAINFSESKSSKFRFAIVAAALVTGVGGASILSQYFTTTTSIQGMFFILALAGGFLSTWSPCGYSSLSLLRPAGKYSAGSVLRWTPTFIAHALGYAIGAVVLGTAAGAIGSLVFDWVSFSVAALGLSVLALGYGAHQLGFLKMPYPQRRAQVPHDARLRFRSSAIGLLYGYALGMNFLTYVQTPILYIVTGAALLSGDVATAIAIFAIFNVGRCLPVAVNFLPVSNQSVQAWLAKRQERAVELDGFLLISMSVAALVLLTF